jgi:DNA (cytosine-5)-methyltransferase 1
MARKGLIPTPTVCGNYNRKGASKASGDGLATWAAKFPTPNARDWKGPPGKGCQDRGGRSSSLPAHVAKHAKQAPLGAAGLVTATGPFSVDPTGGTLNPTWVEWLMGWPLGWSELHESSDSSASATGKFQQWLRSHGVSSQQERGGCDRAI